MGIQVSAGRVILGYSVNHSTQTVAYTQNWLLFAKGRGGPVDLMWIVQTHSGSAVILVPFRKDLARMKGTPQPNQNWEAAQGIEPGSLGSQASTLNHWTIPDT